MMSRTILLVRYKPTSKEPSQLVSHQPAAGKQMIGHLLWIKGFLMLSYI